MKIMVAKILLLFLMLAMPALSGCMKAPGKKAAMPRPATAKRSADCLRPEGDKGVCSAPATIVLSDSGEIFRALTAQLVEHLGPETEILDLSDQTDGDKLPSLIARRKGPLIAVGLEAANALTPQAGRRDVVFTMVFNHGDNRLLQHGMIGVSMLPPPAQVLRLLTELSPDTTRIIMPAGPNIGDYPALARAEAAKLGMALSFREVGSDMELLLLVKELDRATQALWLLPDNRIMSKERLRQVLAVNLKSGRRAVVFSPAFLSLGGLLSAQYNLAAIAETVAEIIGRTPAERKKLKGTMRQPATGTLTINGAIAETLGLKVPRALEILVFEGGAQ